MRRELRVERDRGLPALSWAVHLPLDQREVGLVCGPGVDVAADRWVEGTWPGSFERMAFHEGGLSGSGGLLVDDGLVLVPAFHPYDVLYAARTPAGFYASNSLSFLLAASDLRLRLGYPHYSRDLMRLTRGLAEPDIVLPTSGEGVHLLQLQPFRVSADGRWMTAPLPPAPTFATFAAYRAHLVDRLARHVANARDPARRLRLDPVVALSSGYDSPACAVLAAEAGVGRAVSITHSRDAQDRAAADDSGAQIGEILGLDVRTAFRDTSLSVGGDPVIDEFWATGMSGEEVVFRALEEELRGSLLVTGNYGDTVWSRVVRPTTTLRRVDVAGSSLTEFRLRVGAVQLPLPVVGARAHPSIRVISDSPELQLWSVPGSYDRPIPRRIIEEAGVPRGSFAQEKRAVTMISHRRSIGDPHVRGAVLAHATSQGWSRADARRHRLTELRRQLVWPLLRAARLAARPLGYRLDDLRRHGLHGVEGALAFTWAAERLADRRYGRA